MYIVQFQLTVHLVRKYHRTYYVPQNLSLIVAGRMTKGTTSLLSVIQEQIEPSLVAHGQNLGIRPPGWKRPFVETSSQKREPIAKNLNETVTFPEKDESTGEMVITYLGPKPSAFLERKVRR